MAQNFQLKIIGLNFRIYRIYFLFIYFVYGVDEQR